MQALTFYIAYALFWLLSKLPFWVLYRISDTVYLIVYHIIRYRRKVIFDNLRIAFPQWDERQYRDIARRSTQHFCDIFIEMIKSMSMSKKEMARRFKCENASVVNAFAKAEQPIVILFGHQASYEWTMRLDELLEMDTYAIYKPLRNKRFNQLIIDIRRKFNSELIPMKSAMRAMKEIVASDQTAMFALIADQSPKKAKARDFTYFFNKLSAVQRGAELISREHDAVVFFLNITKTSRGHYSSKFELITKNGSTTDAWEITDQFFTKLEKQITQQPQFYMWSHNRWKVNPEKIEPKKMRLSPRVEQ